MKRNTIVLLSLFLFFGTIVSLAIFTEDDGAYEISKLVDQAEEATTVSELITVLDQFDRLIVKYPAQEQYIDSLSTEKVNDWTHKAEKDNLLKSAYYMAQAHIKTLLKNPNSAKMPSYLSNESTCFEKDGHIIARFWCDATNSYNAVVRSKYQVTMKIDDDKITIIDVITN